ncbi:MAG: hypothetical protein ABFC18_03260 [Rikenellaceae bacterium]
MKEAIQNITDREVLKKILKKDFDSAYKNNGNNIYLAYHQVARLRDIPVERIINILTIKTEQ